MINNKTKILEFLNDILNNKKLYKNEKYQNEFIIDLYNIIHKNELYGDIIEKTIQIIQTLEENDVKLGLIQALINTYNEKLKPKYINKKKTNDGTIYEYSDKYTIYIKNKTIDITYLLSTINYTNVDSIGINDKKHDISLELNQPKLIEKLIKNNKMKKIILCLNKLNN